MKHVVELTVFGPDMATLRSEALRYLAEFSGADLPDAWEIEIMSSPEVYDATGRPKYWRGEVQAVVA